MRTLFIAALGALTLAGVAEARGPVNLRQVNQERRIDAGVRSGKLTRAEAAKLKAEQNQIKALEARLKARHHGKLTAADKRQIEMAQDRADRHILGQKGDAQRGRNKLPI